jgi:hypothetical protein
MGTTSGLHYGSGVGAADRPGATNREFEEQLALPGRWLVRWPGRTLRVPSIARAGSRRRIQWRSQALWQGVYVPSAALKPVPQSFCIRRATDGADPSRWAEG